MDKNDKDIDVNNLSPEEIEGFYNDVLEFDETMLVYDTCGTGYAAYYSTALNDK